MWGNPLLLLTACSIFIWNATVLVICLAITEHNPILWLFLSGISYRYSLKYQLLYLEQYLVGYQMDTNDDRLECNLHSGKTPHELTSVCDPSRVFTGMKDESYLLREMTMWLKSFYGFSNSQFSCMSTLYHSVMMTVFSSPEKYTFLPHRGKGNVECLRNC